MRRITPEIVVGVAGLGVGGVLVAVALGVTPSDPASIHAPGWVLAICGAVFTVGGVTALAQDFPAVRTAAAGVFVAAMTVVMGWIALYGDAAQFSGGTGLLPPAVDEMLARILFGACALLGLAMFVGGTIHLLRGPRER